jgi:Adenylylsulphate kinase
LPSLPLAIFAFYVVAELPGLGASKTARPYSTTTAIFMLCRAMSGSRSSEIENRNFRRVGEVAKLMVESGLIILCAFISPYRSERDMVRRLVDEGEFIEVFVDTPLEV